MHPQLFLLALVAPLALSLPQPVPQGQSEALIARQGSGNSTGGHEGEYYKEKHHGPPGGPHPERDLIERQESGNSTGGAGEGGPHGFKGKKYHGGPPHPERDLSERQESGNSTGGGEHHGPGEYHHEGHPGPKVDKRIEEGNGTTGGDVGKEKFKPDGYHGGPQKLGDDKRSIIDTALDRRQDNSTSSGSEDSHKHEFGKGHFEHKGPE